MIKKESIAQNYLTVLILTFSVCSSFLCFKISDNYGSIYAFRLLLVTGIIYLPLVYSFKKIAQIHLSEKIYITTIILWLMYSLIIYNKAGNSVYALKEITYIGIGLLFSIVLITIKNNYSKFHAIFITSWLIGYIINLLIGYYEFFTKNHIISEYTNYILSRHNDHLIHLSPASVWGNPNNFAIYLVISFLILSIYISKNNLIKFLVYSLPGLFLLLLTYSRLSIACAIIILFVTILQNIEIKKIRNYIYQKRVLVISALIIVLYVFLFNEFINTASTKNISEENSVSIRKNLILNGLHFMAENNYAGIGPGQFQHYMETNKAIYNTQNTTSPHCALIEIISQYGIYLFIVILVNYLYLIYYIYKKHKLKLLFTALYILIIVTILSNVSSGFIKSDLSWLSMMLPYILLDYLNKNDAQ